MKTMTISSNKKARFEYEILDTYEAGILLKGSEVKSIRSNGISLVESHVRIIKSEVFLINAHIAPYAFEQITILDPRATRKLLLNKKEILKLERSVREKGLTVVPLKAYFKAGLVKVEIALGKGKKLHDKRQTMKERTLKREAQSHMKQRNR